MTFTTFINEYWLFLVMVVSAVALIVLGYVFYNILNNAKEQKLEALKKPKIETPITPVEKPVDQPQIQETEPIKIDAPIKNEPQAPTNPAKIENPIPVVIEPIKPVDKTIEQAPLEKKKPLVVTPLKPEHDDDSDIDGLDDEPTPEEREAELLITGKVKPIIVDTPSKPKQKALDNGEEKPKPKRKVPPKYHVLYRAIDNKWYVKKEGSDSIIRVLETQREAVSVATIRALSQNSAIVVHTKEGKIRKQTSLKEAMDPEEDE